jgi:presenilin-like A22 family membrane protease
MKKDILPAITMSCSFICPLLLALMLVPVYPEEYRAFGEATENPINPLIWISLILIFTGIILLFAKRGRLVYIQYFILGAICVTLIYVLYPIFWLVYPYWFYTIEIVSPLNLPLDFPLVLSTSIAVTLTSALYIKPEWYVVNAVGLLVAAGVTAIFGISLAILPAMILLIGLAIYDAFAVYRTKHMIDLADSVTELHLPILFVVPKDEKYSYLKQKGIKKMLKAKPKPAEKGAIFVGLGDVIIPGVLVVSAFAFLPQIVVFNLPANFVVAICTMAGAFTGFWVLMLLIRKGKPHAGLPILNSCTIITYMISYYLVYRDLTFGIKLGW